MHHIASFCDRVIYLERGEIKKNGTNNEVLAAYRNDVMKSDYSDKSIQHLKIDQASGTGRIKITNVSFSDCENNNVTEIASGSQITVRVEYFASDEIENPILDLVIRDSAKGNMFQATNRDFGFELGKIMGKGVIDITIDNIMSNNQVLHFFITLWNSRHTEQFDWKRHIPLKVLGNPVSSGRLLLNCSWKKTRSQSGL